MIDSLRGEVISLGLDHGVIECAGVGYRFLAGPPTLARLTKGETTRVLTSMVVKDDGVTLYGFADEAARTMFHTLQTVSGLGPKLALACLSVFDPAELAELIGAGDAKAIKSIQTIPGVGKKMAERMALELKDKVDGLYSPPAGAAPGREAAVGATDSAAAEQVIEALVGLGFSDKAARPVVDKLGQSMPAATSSELLRAALSELSS
ncbi:Holliday junction branch migration protein RuvA [Corynebacterium liangguodongii]|uniref:Holliday junction branch migration complex subunit RuvA n=1 Tax=Corynebacterium liangguodongii TaxID=2079535 RepID=A0A2S0WEB6_9CORY|nr:Holliday junction branch migration protein RuvA [Corynebacterium liangguodongii]AWB84123.1 Holliday junction branch migration protein RuvA [Corynebacterium liangguodongii]PWC00134.1 Holliday junction branch migration protein RuvA [Corynebacterium liangguodongii]